MTNVFAACHDGYKIFFINFGAKNRQTMKNIVLPTRAAHRLPFYLALEEWVAYNLPAADYFFTWVVAPTVIAGRNQDIEKEVDISYCRSKGIDICRRRSGGGCVFADTSNIMVSFITPDTDVRTTFSAYTERVAAQLRAMGIDAEASGRNDITVGGRKISGNAFYHLPGRSIVHGTMLYDTDMELMMNAITPSRAKLESKKVQSVQSHIVTAHELMPDMSFNEFHRSLVAGLADSSYILTESDIEAVREIEQNYYRPEWLYGRSSATDAGACLTRTFSKRIEGVGELVVTMTTDRDKIIRGVDLKGDFFLLSDLDSALLKALEGVRLSADRLSTALEGIDTGKVIAGMTNSTFVKLMTNTID